MGTSKFVFSETEMQAFGTPQAADVWSKGIPVGLSP